MAAAQSFETRAKAGEADGDGRARQKMLRAGILTLCLAAAAW